MIFKRKKSTENAGQSVAAAETSVREQTAADELQTSLKEAPVDREARGPFDLTEVPAMRPYIDMGGIKVAPREGLKVRLDVDETTKRIVAISLDYEGSTLQVQAFAAPKSTGLWAETREQILESLKSQGAVAVERESVFGTEILMKSQPDAEQLAAVRFFGVDGPRWLLRGVLVGQGALEPEKAKGIEIVFRELVVVRGDAPLPPGELLALKMPENVGQIADTQQ